MLGHVILKDPNTLQAQVATFATEHVSDYNDRVYLFQNIGTLASGGVVDVSRVSDGSEFREQDGRLTRIPKGGTITVATAHEYADFLHSMGGPTNERIQGRADLLKSYDGFAPTIVLLRSDLAKKATPAEHSEWRLSNGVLVKSLSDGANSTTFTLEIEGVSYVARIPNGPNTPHVTDEHLAGAVLGKGMPHLEQIVAASYKEDVTIAEKLPGKGIPDLTIDDERHISDGQLGDLVDTLVTASNRRINFDFGPPNFLYDRKAGFGVVDYASSFGRGYRVATVGNVVGRVARLIDKIGSDRKGDPSKAEYYIDELALSRDKLVIMNKYRHQVTQKLSGSDADEALRMIDTRIQAATHSHDFTHFAA